MNIAARMGFTAWTTGASPRGWTDGNRRDAEESAVIPERVVMKLDPYRVASLHARGPVTITCLTGQLWITIPGEIDDIVLQAGQSRLFKAPVRDIVLSTAGARCPATFGIRAAEPAKHAAWGERGASPFRVEFA